MEDAMAIRVLLVDDEQSFVEPMQKRLAVRRFLVRMANSGPAALEELGREPVDVVVLDVKMPGMDGIETIRVIKERHPLVEVILLTGHANLEASLEGMALGAFDYLLKPVGIDELVYKIEDAHRKKSLQEEKIRRLRATAEARREGEG
jgi:DNA-binding NtrC family response regulator